MSDFVRVSIFSRSSLVESCFFAARTITASFRFWGVGIQTVFFLGGGQAGGFGLAMLVEVLVFVIARVRPKRLFQEHSVSLLACTHQATACKPTRAAGGQPRLFFFFAARPVCSSSFAVPSLANEAFNYQVCIDEVRPVPACE